MHLVRTLKGTLYRTFIRPVQRPKRANPDAWYWSIQDHKEASPYEPHEEPDIASKLKPREMMKVKLVEDDEPEEEKIIIPTGEPPNPENDHKLKQSNDNTFEDDDIPF